MNEPVVVATEATRVTITLGESLELTDTPALLAAARAAVECGCGVAVECGNLPFLSTAVVQILIALRRACRGRELSFEVTGILEPAAAHLRRAGVDSALLS